MHLTPDETLALVTFARHMIRADGQIADTEVVHLMGMARTVGIGKFHDALQKSQYMRPLDRPDLRILAGLVREPAVRRFMYDQLELLARSDGLAFEEVQMLEDLAEWWEISDIAHEPQGAQVPVMHPLETPVA